MAINDISLTVYSLCVSKSSPFFFQRKSRCLLNVRDEHPTSYSAGKAVLQWVFCWENWSSFMCSWQDEIHLLGAFFLAIFLLNVHYRPEAAKFFLELLTIFENLLKLWMFMMKCTKFPHVMQLAGKSISAIFLGVKNTF